MSRYESEWGTVSFTQKNFRELKKVMVEFFNDRQEKLHALAIRLHDEVKLQAKGKRGFDKYAWINEQFVYQGHANNVCCKIGAMHMDHDEESRIIHSLFGHETEKGFILDRKKMKKPQKKAFPKQKLSGNFHFYSDQGEASFDAKNFTLHWSVDEGNKAVESAHNAPMGSKLFDALDRLDWGKKGGGLIYGTDEHARDAAHDYGGSAESVNRYLGPNGQAEQKRKWGF